MDTTSISNLPTNTQPSGDMQPTGGMQPSGGMQPTGGMQPSGGMQPTGGMQPSGGMQSTSGGMQPTGGMQLNAVSNVSPNTSYTPNVTAQPSAPITLSKDMIQEVTNSIQKASLDGSTQLPSRDIPRDTLHLAADVQVNADHVPLQENMRDYIGDYDDTQGVIQKHLEEQQKINQLDIMYNEIQTPVLIMLLYFLFQLPVVNSMVFKLFPKLFHKDGNITIGGLLLKTILYGGIYYGIMKGISYI